MPVNTSTFLPAVSAISAAVSGAHGMVDSAKNLIDPADIGVSIDATTVPNLAVKLTSTSALSTPEQVLRDYNNKKSWLDATASAWFERSFFSKAIAVTTFVAFSGLIGIFAGASIFFGLAAALISLVAHKLLVAHDENRRSRGNFFAGAAANVIEATKVLNTQSAELLNAVPKLDEANEFLQEQNAKLVSITDAVETATTDLAANQAAATKVLESVVEGMEDLAEMISDTVTQAKDVEIAVSKFSDAVDSFKEASKEFSNFGERFHFFVDDACNSQATSHVFVDENERAMEQMKAQLQMREPSYTQTASPK